MKSNKFRTPLCEIVLDVDGIAIDIWGINKGTNVTIVINEKQIIEYLYEGKLNKEQIKKIMSLTNIKLPGENNKSQQEIDEVALKALDLFEQICVLRRVDIIRI